jgi:hypothetical protein
LANKRCVVSFEVCSWFRIVTYYFTANWQTPTGRMLL